MKAKLFILFFLFFGVFSAIAQEAKIIEDSTKIEVTPNDGDDETLEDETVIENEDSIYKAHLYYIDSANYPYLPINNLTDTLNKLKNQEEYWYVNAVFKDKTKKNNVQNNNGFWSTFFASLAFRIIIWTLIIGVAITVLVLFFNENNISFFKRKSRNVNDASTNETKEENIFETDFDKAIELAKNSNDFPLATRLHYLHILLLLHQQGKIIYSKEKTNFDYLVSLGNTNLYKDFAKATRNYEFVWYGDFELNKDQYFIIETVFLNLKKQIQ
jgi:hypothetical protein